MSGTEKSDYGHHMAGLSGLSSARIAETRDALGIIAELAPES